MKIQQQKVLQDLQNNLNLNINLDTDFDSSLNIFLDRSLECFVVEFSSNNIILRESVCPLHGFKDSQAISLNAELSKTIIILVNYFLENSGSKLKANFFENKLTSIEFSLDDNAKFKHPELVKYADKKEKTAIEKQAEEYGLNYIALDGSIACLVNGAGLAMATMDVIKESGLEPANFLDIGGAASQESIEQAFKIIAQSSNVKALFINVFGGIVKCDLIANALINTISMFNFPVVVRLEGTNSKLAKQLLQKANLNIILADSLDSGVKLIIKEVQMLNNKKLEKLEAVLFDCDGVLMDTEMSYRQIMVDLLNQHDYEITLEQACKRWQGKIASQVMQELIEEGHQAAYKLEGFDELINKSRKIDESYLVDKIKDTLEHLHGLKIPKAVCSNTKTVRLGEKLQEATIAHYFDEFIGYDLAGALKPNPQIYLKGAESLKVNPANCIVVEDSPTGVQAGVAANCFVVGFTGTGQNEELLKNAGAHAIIDDMQKLPELIESIKNA